jgi:hypothetical protein
MKMGYIISHPRLKLEIKLEKIRKLFFHEEVIPELVEKISRGFRKNIIENPVIVDKDTLVVLDGIHRIVALNDLGYKLVPVCLVNYENPMITVGSWFRIIEKDDKTKENLRKDLEKSGFVLQEIVSDDITKKMKDREISIGIVTVGKCYGIPGKIEKLKEIYDLLNQLENILRSFGYKIRYELEKYAIEKVNSGKALATIIVPQITKRDVIETALSGEKFIPKSTCHMIPARPLFINIPIKWLNMNPKKANHLLIKHLSKKRLKHLPSGQILDRRYEEELYIFNDFL